MFLISCILKETFSFSSVVSFLTHGWHEILFIVVVLVLMCLRVFSDAARMAWSQSGLFLKTSAITQNPFPLSRRDGGRMKQNPDSWYIFINNNLRWCFSFIHLQYYFCNGGKLIYSCTFDEGLREFCLGFLIFLTPVLSLHTNIES